MVIKQYVAISCQFKVLTGVWDLFCFMLIFLIVLITPHYVYFPMTGTSGKTRISIGGWEIDFRFSKLCITLFINRKCDIGFSFHKIVVIKVHEIVEMS